MSGYGVFADFYDSLTLNVDYRGRAEYILKILKELGHSPALTLDLACGTGSLTAELAERGFDIYGVDGSPEMLSRALEKARSRGLDILFLCQEMQNIDLYGTVDACLCTLDSINHMTDFAQIQRTFDRVSLFMNPGGYFIFDVNTIYKHQKILGNNTFVYDTEKVYCVWQNSLKENNIVDIDLDFFYPRGGVYYRGEEHFSERAYSDAELTKALEKSGFKVAARYGDMTLEAPKKDEQRVVYAAVKM